jgi:S1-C subfamily serine protease
MTEYPSQEEEQKKSRTRWLIGCGSALLVTSCLLVFIFIGGYAGLRSLLNSAEESWNISVDPAMSSVEDGDTFQVTVSIENTSRQNINIRAIELPEELLSNALVTDVDPEGDSQQFGEMGMTTYRYDLVIAPTGTENIIFTLTALNEGDIRGNISVQTESTTKSAGLRVVILEDAVAIVPTEITGRTEQPGGMVMGDSIPYQSVVKITALFDVDGELFEGWTGSGTIVSSNGLILTNAHVVLSDRFFTVADLLVAITQEQDSPPVNMFLADVVQANENLDLAVIKIRSKIDGSPANFSDLGITPVPLGDSELLQLGDSITILGYPGIGGETITLTRGEVSGFTPEAPYGNRAFIKTSATIAGGNSGGLAVNDQGQIIGIPTQLGTGNVDDIIVDCRPLADTNRDGVIDDTDVCVSTGGFINALRPIALALPLIESAQAGEVAIIPEETGGDHEEYQPEGNVVLIDEFSDNRNSWALGDFESGWIDILEDQLIITINTDSFVQWTSLPGEYNELIMVADGQILSSVGDGEAGFVCGYEDTENFTILEVSEDGYYTIWKYQDDEYISLLDWEYSDAIDLSQPFTLAAYCGPDSLRLAINDVLLAQVVDSTYSAGSVGLMAGTWDNPGVSVSFDTFIILNP